MPILFWCTISAMALSTIAGLVGSFRLYDRIGGYGSSEADLDRIVRESW
jgi:hypothetical protein